MDQKKRKARTARLVSFGVLANKINAYRYGVPKSVVRELVDYRMMLACMQDDEELRQIAENLLEVTELLIGYSKALNGGNAEMADEIMQHAVRKWNANDQVINEFIEKDGE
jgi:hypothetical protein